MTTPEDSNIVEAIIIEGKNIYFLKDGETFSKFLNSSKDKLTFEVNLPSQKRTIYSANFTFEELSKISPLFSIEENLDNIDQLISESIMNYGIKILEDDEEENNQIIAIIKFSINSKIKEIKFKLNKAEISEEQFISSLFEKINYFLDERKKNYGIKSFNKVKEELSEKEKKISDELEILNEKLDKMGKTFINFNKFSLVSNSHIINDLEDIKFISEAISSIELNEGKRKKKFIEDILLYKLIFRASRDGDSSREFHKRCDNIGPNITLIKTEDNQIFGGFTMENWKVKKGQKKEIKQDPESFCFTMNIKEEEKGKEKIIRKKYIHNIDKEEAIFCSKDYGPTFSNNIFCVYDNFLSKGGYCDKNEKSCFDGQEKDYEISGGNKYFKIKELEVFEIIN